MLWGTPEKYTFKSLIKATLMAFRNFAILFTKGGSIYKCNFKIPFQSMTYMTPFKGHRHVRVHTHTTVHACINSRNCSELAAGLLWTWEPHIASSMPLTSFWSSSQMNGVAWSYLPPWRSVREGNERFPAFLYVWHSHWRICAPCLLLLQSLFQIHNCKVTPYWLF